MLLLRGEFLLPLEDLQLSVSSGGGQLVAVSPVVFAFLRHRSSESIGPHFSARQATSMRLALSQSDLRSFPLDIEIGLSRSCYGAECWPPAG